jgi:hypothetical protein
MVQEPDRAARRGDVDHAAWVARRMVDIPTLYLCANSCSVAPRARRCVASLRVGPYAFLGPWARLLPSAVRLRIRSRSTSASPPSTASIKRRVLVPVSARG